MHHTVSFFLCPYGIVFKAVRRSSSDREEFFRNLVAAVIAFIMIIRNKEKIQIQKRNLHWFILRSLLGP